MSGGTENLEATPQIELPVEKESFADSTLSTLPDEQSQQEIIPKQSEISDADIAQAEKELAELERRANQPAIDYDKFSQTLTKSLEPLIPKSPDPKKPWETDEYLNDPKSFRETLAAWQNHNISEFQKKTVEPLVQRLAQLEQIIPLLYASRAENPLFTQVQSRASEIAEKYRVSFGTALQMAQDEFANKTQQRQVRSVPPHASAPETKQQITEEIQEKGPAKFKDIVGELKRSGKF